jgi:hypothetical protein
MPIIGDGRILYLDVHTNQIVCIGKGPSGTTVSAPQTVPAQGASIMITGTVTDQSPSGKRNVNGFVDVPLAGTPAISDESMDGWMEHLYQNRPAPANTTGVNVSLDTIDPNGNYIHIGDVKSDKTGTYGYKFTPEVAGTYEIIATFAGSKAYGPSEARTYMAVGEPTATPAQTATPQPSVADLYFVPATIGIIAAIAIVGAILGALLLRKHP